ncbi:hypothetical protein CY34DRAFT_801478 [Suillus luteus UH-Slu-Lm8-n1]|uniref:Uncharacterized protein n=1 Tax=Suillus luteus UH-Slu-Lm8-n1 TaxID=930992 RepID=A0A0D0AV75_9AGAM|nr:hypothetical protein CY34DRAFT_801478 [Suillus luteus UH-Slu-Lm8-n1]
MPRDIQTHDPPHRHSPSPSTNDVVQTPVLENSTLSAPADTRTICYAKEHSPAARHRKGGYRCLTECAA